VKQSRSVPQSRRIESWRLFSFGPLVKFSRTRDWPSRCHLLEFHLQLPHAVDEMIPRLCRQPSLVFRLRVPRVGQGSNLVECSFTIAGSARMPFYDCRAEPFEVFEPP